MKMPLRASARREKIFNPARRIPGSLGGKHEALAYSHSRLRLHRIRAGPASPRTRPLCARASTAWHRALVPALLAGDYQGKLGPIPIRLHLRIVDGDLTGTLDGPDTTGIRVDRIATVGNLLSFRVPALRATWTGTVGHTLAGTWTQGEASAPLNLGRMQ